MEKKDAAMERQNRLLAARIRYFSDLKGISAAQLMEAIGVSRATFYLRMQKPGAFSYDELRGLSRCLGVSVTELIREEG